jgi:glycosyltransferase involved in cell wall biosynthesis
MSELVSVIVPIYKVEQYLARCVESIRNQTYENLEIILVDDESPDGCPKMCDEYKERDSRIRVIHQQNKGLSGARNAGIDIASGEYLVFVDSDDFIDKDFVWVLYEAAKETNSEIALCKYEYVKGDGLTQSHKLGKRSTFTGVQLIEEMYSPDGAFFVVAWNKLYHKSLFTNIRYPEGRIHEDEATTHQLYFEAKKGVFVDRYLYGYFIGGESITRKKFNRNRLDWAWSVGQRMDFMEEKKLGTLLPTALRHYADGVIDLYFQCKDGLPDSKLEQKKLKGIVRMATRRVRKYGSFPVKTQIGYALFLLMPDLYRKVLGAYKAPVLKEKVMDHYDKE